MVSSWNSAIHPNTLRLWNTKKFEDCNNKILEELRTTSKDQTAKLFCDENCVWFCYRKHLTKLPNDTLVFKCSMKIHREMCTDSYAFKSKEACFNAGLKELSKDFKEMFEEESHSDITLVTGTTTLEANLCVLRSRSRILDEIFNLQKIPPETRLGFHDLDVSVLKNLIGFMYMGCIPDDFVLLLHHTVC
ncbi:hypothetical protein CEXT_15281 [Caerostris extrusa]|uniref:BTB domain-containing protein n=1 Tax=Caerostris extrusa TaxID=172846 RepID=A0AAV4NE49_CAEEX|nr:hypothetical protein CEXT_15281 [Caerostris extrusa]